MPLLKLIDIKLFNNVSLEKLQSEYGYWEGPSDKIILFMLMIIIGL